MNERLNLSAGDWVEVRSKEEILATLDQKGQLDQLPFMPQMFQYCGQRLRVYKRAHKTCDTVNKTGGRRMANAVHLEAIRCDGNAHGGCQVACLIFWKEAWLKRVNHEAGAACAPSAAPPVALEATRSGNNCSEADVLAGTRLPGSSDDPTYVCQATQLPQATQLLKWWDIRQYIEDYTSGNVGLNRILKSFLFKVYCRLINLGIGWGSLLRALYDRVQKLRGGVPFPRKQGKVPKGAKTPSSTLNLQPGEWVRVKSHEEILETLDFANKNRGLYFDMEEVPFCGGIYRVQRRVSKLIDEKTGKMMQFKTDSVILEGVCCQARYSDLRLFCPRSIYPMWREIWLERVELDAVGQPKGSPGGAPSRRMACHD